MSIYDGDNKVFFHSRRSPYYFLWHVFFKENFRTDMRHPSVESLEFTNWAFTIAKQVLIKKGEITAESGHIKEACEQYITLIEKTSRDDLICIDLFEWMEKDRPCYFIWLNLKQLNSKDPTAIAYNGSNLYNNYGLSQQPTSTNERLNAIIQFFDLWLVSKADKLNYIETLKESWHKIFAQKKDPFPWLNKKDEEQCKWAWTYFKKDTSLTSGPPSSFSLLELCNPANSNLNINPVSPLEQYHAAYALYDSWPDSAEKKLFKLSLDKAWSQKKFRDNKAKAHQKPLNTFLDIQTKKQLDELTGAHNKNIQEMINFLIKQEHEKLNS